MTVHLHRHHRAVTATGPDRAPLPVAVRDHLVDRLTYYTRNYVHAYDGGTYQTTERRQYVVDRATGGLTFSLGLLPGVAADLALRDRVVVHGRPIADANPEAHRLDVDAVLRDFKIFFGQDECLAQIAAADGGIVAASVGWGKTEVIKMVCVMYPAARIHVVTKAADVAHDLHARLLGSIPDVGFVGDGKRVIRRVTVFVADSMHHGDGDADIFMGDEAHELVAPRYIPGLSAYRSTRMFGFTATPTGRHDGRDRELEAVFGPILYTLTYQESEAAGRVVPTTVEWLKIESGPVVAGMRPVDRERVGVWQNDHRNGIIAARLLAVPAADQTLAITATIDHAVRLKALLPGFDLCYSHTGMEADRFEDYKAAGLLPADAVPMTKARRMKMRQEFAAGRLKKVVANYVWSTGVDFPLLRVLARADAGGKGKGIKDFQIPGRTSRAVPGVKDEALVLDCWDAWDPTMLDRSRGRRRNYQGYGWSQVFGDTPVPVTRAAHETEIR